MIRFRVEWQDAPGVKDTVLARTWCRLTIEAAGRLVTEVLDNRSRSLRGGIYGSVFTLEPVDCGELVVPLERVVPVPCCLRLARSCANTR